MKMTHKFFALPVLMGALLIAGTTQNAHAAPDPLTNKANVEVSLDVEAIAEIEATVVNATLTPTRPDYVAGYVEQTGAINLKVFSNTPYIVTVEGQSSSPSLSSSHLLVRKTGGSYAPVSSLVTIEDAPSSAASGDPIGVDLKVTLPNTGTYAPDEAHTNTITFTVAPSAD